MASGTVILFGFLILPVTLEASSVTRRRCFEGSFRWLVSRFAADRYRYIRALICYMTTGTVHTLMVSLVVRVVTRKLYFHRLLALFWKFVQFSRAQSWT